MLELDQGKQRPLGTDDLQDHESPKLVKTWKPVPGSGGYYSGEADERKKDASGSRSVPSVDI